MSVEITQAESLTEEQRQQLFGWGENIFDAGDLNLSWRSKDLHLLLYSDGKLVSHVGVLKHSVKVSGKPALVGGVGGVVTIPEAQQQGFARRLMRYTADFLKQWEVEAGLLFCLPKMVSYYGSLGWQRVERPVVIEQPEGKIVSPLGVMVLPFRQQDWSSAEIELESLPW